MCTRNRTKLEKLTTEDTKIELTMVPLGQSRDFSVSLMFECDVADAEPSEARPFHETREDGVELFEGWKNGRGNGPGRPLGPYTRCVDLEAA